LPSYEHKRLVDEIAKLHAVPAEPSEFSTCWRPQQRAWCKVDNNGDIDHVVSATARQGSQSEVALVSFKWSAL
jgi:hypothetical protein